MQAAVIAMQTATVPDERERGILAAEARHAVAIAGALPGFGISSCLICGTDSPVAQIPLAVPRLCIRPHALGALFRLWQWQGKYEKLLIFAVGADSLPLAQWLLRMGKKGSRRLISAFFLQPPGKQHRRVIERSQCCICGSQLIRANLEEIPGKTRPEFVDVAPGIDIGQYQQASPWQAGKRFIFGMGASLRPDSGALLLVRAMAALWQREDLPLWETRMFGGGDRFEEILQEAEKLGVNSRLAILGEQPLEEVCRHCHVWLAPGTASDELPSILWAGFAARLPLISAASPLHYARLLHKDVALEIDPENPQQMARMMRELMQDAGLREKMAEKSKVMLPEISLGGMAQRVCNIMAQRLGEEPQCPLAHCQTQPSSLSQPPSAPAPSQNEQKNSETEAKTPASEPNAAAFAETAAISPPKKSILLEKGHTRRGKKASSHGKK